jgi:hypothetical protein
MIRPRADLIAAAVAQSVGHALTLYLSSRLRTVNGSSREGRISA